MKLFSNLQNFFTELQEREKELGIADIQLGLTTLEEVFLNIAKQAELETAAAEGTFASLILNSGTSLQVRDFTASVHVPCMYSTDTDVGFKMCRSPLEQGLSVFQEQNRQKILEA